MKSYYSDIRAGGRFMRDDEGVELPISRLRGKRRRLRSPRLPAKGLEAGRIAAMHLKFGMTIALPCSWCFQRSKENVMNNTFPSVMLMLFQHAPARSKG
ncbi:hypothetical protein ABH995_000922 [Bradyrhizobium yuanmingense]|uniref:hypothetical protein n=1 Tax=Bradyrhizobium yuanmingense TaxID=108015 RepID=UPI003519855C